MENNHQHIFRDNSFVRLFNFFLNFYIFAIKINLKHLVQQSLHYITYKQQSKRVVDKYNREVNKYNQGVVNKCNQRGLSINTMKECFQ